MPAVFRTCMRAAFTWGIALIGSVGYMPHRREDERIGVIANRIRRNTLTYQTLIRFLQTLGIPIVATIRDSQNYVRAAELGIGVHEMKSYVAQEDVEQWEPLVEWLSKPSGTRAPSQNPPPAPAVAV